MLTEERQKKIIELIEKQSIVKSQELIRLLNASESTIRRDLQELENAGLLKRIHGGARSTQQLSFEANMTEKSLKNVQEKQQIAQVAAEEIENTDVIYIDAGSTTLEMIPYLANKNMTVVTNSVIHAAKLVELEIETIILGGNIKLSTNAVLGSTSLSQLQNFRFNKSFMGMNGVHLKHGYTTPDPEEAALKRLAMEHSEEVFVLVDESKMNQVTFTHVLPIEAATIITNPSPVWKDLQTLTTIKEATV